MANSSSEDETDTSPERPTRIQPYQFEPVRQDFERVPEHRVSFDMRYSMGFAKSHSLKCSLHKWWAWCGAAARKSARLNCINLIHFCLTAGLLRGSSCTVIPGVVCELLQFAATPCQQAGIVNFFVDHTHTQFTEESKMATALTPQTDVTSREAYRKSVKSVKNPIKHFFFSIFFSLNLKLVTHLSIISMVILHT